jgi:6-phosphogluconolactonase
MSVAVEFLEFPDRASASVAAAGIMAESVQARLAERGRCAIVVSGGTSPGPCFDQLARMPMDWSRVTVVPSDERWVPPSHPDSNERLIRERLLVDNASAGRLLPMFREGLDVEAAVDRINRDLAGLDSPFASVLLGMGADGHFASLFPDFTGLQQALDPNDDRSCLAVTTAGSPYTRISLNLSALLDSNRTLLLIYGAAKRQVFDAAVTGDRRYPVSSLLRHERHPMTVFWAP